MSNVETKNLAAKLTEFIAQFRILLVSIAVAVIVGLIALVVITQVNSAKWQKAGVELELVDDLHAQLTSATDEAARKDISEKFDNAIATVSADYPGTYFHQRTLYLKASSLFEQKNYKGAKETFLTAVGVRSDSQLAGLCQYNAAVSAGFEGNAQESISLFTKMVEEYKNKSPQVPRALFNLAELSEEKNDFQAASKYYTQMVDEFSDSGWTKIARDRIIKLKTEKKI